MSGGVGAGPPSEGVPSQPALEPAQRRGRFAVLLDLPGPLEGRGGRPPSQAPRGALPREKPGGAWQEEEPAGEHWQRHLWFRFEVRVAGWGLAWEARRVVDVLVDPAAEKPRVLKAGEENRQGPPGGPLPGAVPVLPAPMGMAWVPDYELARFGPLALGAAVAVAQREARRLRQALRPLYEAEARRMAAYFARRRVEALAGMVGSLRQVERASALAMVGCTQVDGGAGGRLRRLADQAAARWQLAREALAAVEEESRRAAAELQARSRPTATVSPAGVAVWWGRCPARGRAPAADGRT